MYNTCSDIESDGLEEAVGPQEESIIQDIVERLDESQPTSPGMFVVIVYYTYAYSIRLHM